MTKEERCAYNKNWRETHKEYFRKYKMEYGRRIRGSKRTYKHWTCELKDEFTKMYQDKANYHISEIAMHFGVSKVALQTLARRLKVRRG